MTRMGGIVGAWPYTDLVGFVGRVRAVALALVIVGCGSNTSTGPSRDDDGRVISGGEVEALDLQLGDCFNDPASAEIEKVDVVPCSTDHDFEVYHVFQLPDGEYPGPERLEEQWIQGCLPEFEPFVGASFDESVLDISAIFPTNQSWDDLNDREVLCSVTAVDSVPRSSSAQGSGV